jgi:hypothetical protein
MMEATTSRICSGLAGFCRSRHSRRCVVEAGAVEHDGNLCQLGVGPHALIDRPALHVPWQPQVEQHQADMPTSRREGGKRLLAIRCNQDGIAGEAKQPRQRLRDVGVIIDDEDRLRLGI